MNEQVGQCSAKYPVSCNDLGTNSVNPEPREIIRLLAEKVMGWKIHAASDEWCIVDTGDGTASLDGRRNLRQWNPLTSIADAYEMEGALPEELRPRYILELAEIAIATNNPYGRMWSMAHAWPELRCKAAVAALKAGGRP